jgi:hypothetical protein
VKGRFVGLAGLLIMATLSLGSDNPLSLDQQIGAALFQGMQPLRARVLGHAQDLPPIAARCANCHTVSRSQGADEGRATVTALLSQRQSRPKMDPTSSGDLTRNGKIEGALITRIGPVLSAQTLQTATPRRGGPASFYNQAAFCRVLQDGIDPAWVQLKRAMPRYRLSESECRGLWIYLTA